MWAVTRSKHYLCLVFKTVAFPAEEGTKQFHSHTWGAVVVVVVVGGAQDVSDISSLVSFLSFYSVSLMYESWMRKIKDRRAGGSTITLFLGTAGAAWDTLSFQKMCP